MAEEFDDDTDFALPDVSPPSGSQNAMPPAQMEMMQQMMQQMQGGTAPRPPPSSNVVMDGEEDGPHKHWTCIYPIYMDAKRRYRHGCRRVPYSKAVLFPNSQYISNAAKKLNMEFRHEPYRTHPQDWENPGRVKVRLFHEDGKPIRADIPTKQKLIEVMATLLQPHAGGTPPPLADRATYSKKSSRAALRPRQRVIRSVPFAEQLPPHSPVVATGLLNMDMAKMPGAEALKSMGPLGSMMSSMGLGDDEEAEATAAAAPPQRQQPALGRRQRKRVVRIGR